MPSDLDLLAAKVAELLSKPARRQKARPMLNFRVSVAELATINAAARDKGVCRSDFIRLALNAVLPEAIQTDREIPPGFVRMHARRKAARFDDGQTDRARIRQNIEHRTELRASDAAVAQPQNEQGMLAQPRPTKFPR